MDGNLALNAHFENLPEEAMKEQENNVSPIDGLNMEQLSNLKR